MSAGASRVQERCSDPLELGLLAVVGCLTWVLGAKLSPARALCTLSRPHSLPYMDLWRTVNTENVAGPKPRQSQLTFSPSDRKVQCGDAEQPSSSVLGPCFAPTSSLCCHRAFAHAVHFCLQISSPLSFSFSSYSSPSVFSDLPINLHTHSIDKETGGSGEGKQFVQEHTASIQNVQNLLIEAGRLAHCWQHHSLSSDSGLYKMEKVSWHKQLFSTS